MSFNFPFQAVSALAILLPYSFTTAVKGMRKQAGHCLLPWDKLFAVQFVQLCQNQWLANWSKVIAVSETSGLVEASWVDGGFLTPVQVQ